MHTIETYPLFYFLPHSSQLERSDASFHFTHDVAPLIKFMFVTELSYYDDGYNFFVPARETYEDSQRVVDEDHVEIWRRHYSAIR